jgi:hypothetical protein
MRTVPGTGGLTMAEQQLLDAWWRAAIYLPAIRNWRWP